MAQQTITSYQIKLHATPEFALGAGVGQPAFDGKVFVKLCCGEETSEEFEVGAGGSKGQGTVICDQMDWQCVTLCKHQQVQKKRRVLGVESCVWVWCPPMHMCDVCPCTKPLRLWSKNPGLSPIPQTLA